ncbi:MAG: Gfo/Idh/MocA family protein [Janthinobacterium lividum]
MGKQLCVAVIGLHFGADFVPIYQHHPDISEVVVCDQDPSRLREVGDRFGIERRFTSLDDVLRTPDIDAVHLFTPLLFHAAQSVRVLEAGKHCACAVTMGVSLDELAQVIKAEKSSGKNYMMMETVVYSREFLFVKNLYDSGELGDLTFLRGVYFQDIEGRPDYWRSVPPMHYATHAVAPLLALTGTRATGVNCLGSGLLSPRLKQPGGNPFRLETGLFRLENSTVVAEVTRSWFETARPYLEGFHVYGSKRGFEWSQVHGEKPVLFTLSETVTPYGRPVDTVRVDIPDYADHLPEEIRRFTEYERDGAHGGSHPHLANEFVRSILEERPATIDAVTAATWTAPGICAHESALSDGALVTIPSLA